MKIPKFLRDLLEFMAPENIDDEFLESYRKLLFGQYAILNSETAKKEADRIIQMDPEDVEWEDLYQLELAIIKIEPIDSLRERIWTLRNEYKEIASVGELKDYIASNPPDPKTASELSVRADATLLQIEMNWRYVVMWVFESFRANIIKSLVRATSLLLVGTFLLILFWEKISSHLAFTTVNLSLLGMIIVPGILGGVVSTIQRVQKARLRGNADVDLSELQEGKLGIYMSPVLGGVFAMLLFFLFAGEFMTGHMFPKVSFDNLLLPESDGLEMAEMSKVVIWSFIAGFAERFVPDKLERFTKDASQEDSTKNSNDEG
jgi:hypothetical protein